MVQTKMANEQTSFRGLHGTASRALRAACLGVAVLAVAPLLTGGSTVMAQGEGNLFSPRYIVNGAAITAFEIEQRATFIRALRLPGDPEKEAVRLLIEDRLGAQAARAAEISVSEQEVSAGMTEFASRANMPVEEFTKALDAEGVAPETFRDFVQAGLQWRALVRQKFPVETLGITEAEIDRAIAQTLRQPEIKVLLSELFLPVEGDNVTEVLDQARAIKADVEAGRISFGAAARQYSAAPTGANGGRLDWMDLTNLPPAVGEKLLALAPGGVGDPMVVPNAVALFQLNNMSESAGPAAAAVQVRYGEYLVAPGEDIAAIRAKVDRCVDLDVIARGLPADRLAFKTQMMSEVPQDIGLELAKLDVNEASTALHRGQWQVFLMLCQRQGLTDAPAAPAAGTPEAEAAAKSAAAEKLALAADPSLLAVPEGKLAPNRESVRQVLVNQRLEQLATGYMEELRSEAVIVEK